MQGKLCTSYIMALGSNISSLYTSIRIISTENKIWQYKKKLKFFSQNKMVQDSFHFIFKHEKNDTFSDFLPQLILAWSLLPKVLVPAEAERKYS